MTETVYHRPVLLKESIDGLAIKSDGVYVDVTYGGGGHSAAILEQLGSAGRLIAFDRDKDAQENAASDPRFRLLHHNFRYLNSFLRYYKALPVDGILADLGISSHQIDVPSRGFSTRYDAPLDMRMDQRSTRTAADLLNFTDKKSLITILREYGELDQAVRIAEEIVKKRKIKALETTSDLIALLEPMAPKDGEHKFYAQVFQAIRIEINDELVALKSLLEHSINALKPGGRLVVISYHSLEDRMVKNYMKAGNIKGVEEKDPIYGNSRSPMKLLTRGAVAPGTEEIAINKRARSARLRIAEKV